MAAGTQGDVLRFCCRAFNGSSSPRLFSLLILRDKIIRHKVPHLHANTVDLWHSALFIIMLCSRRKHSWEKCRWGGTCARAVPKQTKHCAFTILKPAHIHFGCSPEPKRKSLNTYEQHLFLTDLFITHFTVWSAAQCASTFPLASENNGQARATPRNLLGASRLLKRVLKETLASFKFHKTDLVFPDT